MVTLHVVAATWLALALVGPAVGVVALVGGDLVEAVLGDAYRADVGGELARVLVVLSTWIVAAVGVNVTFPLAFVAGRLRALPWIGLGALGVQLVLAAIGLELLELEGIALSLGLSTFVVLAALLWQLGAAGTTLRGVLLAAASIAALTGAAFLPVALISRSAGGVVAALLLYVALVAVLRPRPLVASWSYLRGLT